VIEGRAAARTDHAMAARAVNNCAELKKKSANSSVSVARGDS
jgi:hypothetical protein